MKINTNVGRIIVGARVQRVNKLSIYSLYLLTTVVKQKFLKKKNSDTL